MRTKLTIGLIIFALIIIFIIQNMVIVEIRFFFWTLSISRSLLMIFLLAAGFIAGWFLNQYVQHKKKTSQ